MNVDGDITVCGSAYIGMNNLSISSGLTLTEAQMINTVIYCDGAAVVGLASIASMDQPENVNFIIHTEGDVAVSIKPDLSDKLRLDGAWLDNGDKTTNKSDTADCAVITYRSVDGFYASTGSLTTPFTWADGGQ